MGLISKKKIRKKQRDNLIRLGLEPDDIFGRTVIRSGAFGRPKWMRGRGKGIYTTFAMSNHDRNVVRRIEKEEFHRNRLNGIFSKEL